MSGYPPRLCLVAIVTGASSLTSCPSLFVCRRGCSTKLARGVTSLSFDFAGERTFTARRGLFVSSQTRACESLSISLFPRYSSPKRLQRGTSSSGFEDSACIKRLLARLVCNVSLGYLPRRRSGLSLSFRPEFFVHTWALF